MPTFIQTIVAGEGGLAWIVGMDVRVQTGKDFIAKLKFD